MDEFCRIFKGGDVIGEYQTKEEAQEWLIEQFYEAESIKKDVVAISGQYEGIEKTVTDEIEKSIIEYFSELSYEDIYKIVNENSYYENNKSIFIDRIHKLRQINPKFNICEYSLQHLDYFEYEILSGLELEDIVDLINQSSSLDVFKFWVDAMNRNKNIMMW